MAAVVVGGVTIFGWVENRERERERERESELMQNWPWASCSSDGCSMELLMLVKAYGSYRWPGLERERGGQERREGEGNK